MQENISEPGSFIVKNNMESITAHAKVQFEPFSTTGPSLSKVRRKVRPTPRFNPIRRNNKQSTNECEDESNDTQLQTGRVTSVPTQQRTDSLISIGTTISSPGRELMHIRNESVCSDISQLPDHLLSPGLLVEPNHPAMELTHNRSKSVCSDIIQKPDHLPPNSPVGQNHPPMELTHNRSESVCSDISQKPDHLPSPDSPLEQSHPSVELTRNRSESVCSVISQKADHLPSPGLRVEQNHRSISDEDPKVGEANAKEPSMEIPPDFQPEEISDAPSSAEPVPVPQIKLGPNGEIIVGEQSLVIKESLTEPDNRLEMNNGQFCDHNKSSVSESRDQSHTAHMDITPPTQGLPQQRTESFNSNRSTPSPDRSRRQKTFRRENVKTDASTMYDLIFYNPSSKPIITDKEELRARDANQKENSRVPEPVEDDSHDPPSSEPAPMPQIKLGSNGEIVLDEQSLVINQRANREISSSVVVEGSWTELGSARYKRGPRTAEWKDEETVRFYRALAALGTDFTLMERLFPGRTRRDLKLKFKKEERENGDQVYRALHALHEWNVDTLEEEFTAERQESKQRVKENAERLRQRLREERERQKSLKELGVRKSKASKAMESSILPESNPGTIGLTADDFIRRHLENLKKEAQKPKRKPRTTKKKSQPVPIAGSTKKSSIGGSMATIQKTSSSSAPPRTPELLNSATGVPSNIESGSLVVLTVDDPASPSKKMLQTYIAHGGGKLTPVALPPNLLSSVVSYMKRGAPRSAASDASSPCSAASERGSRSTTPGALLHTPTKRQ